MPIDADAGDVVGTGLAVRDLVEQLQGSGAGNVILLVDACRDDGNRDGVGIGMERQKGVIMLFSCAPSELSYEIDELQAGAFTYALLQGLRIQGEGNCATVARLAEHVRVQVPYLVEQYRQTRQNPYLVAEPASKQNLILLPKQASPADLRDLKYAASKVENEGDRELARDFWIRVLAFSPDMESVAAIERLAVSNLVRRSNAARNIGDSRSGLKNRMPSLLIWLKKITRVSSQLHLRKILLCLPGLLLTFLLLGLLKSWGDSSNKAFNEQSLEYFVIARFSNNDVKGGVEAVSELLEQGELETARSVLDKLTDREKDHPSINYLRGRLVMESIRRRKNSEYSVSDARRAFLRATEDEPKNPAYLNALGFSYYEEVDMEQAQEAWSQVVDLSD
jgi:tetratricopeptide (TPR) repeat protein